MTRQLRASLTAVLIALLSFSVAAIAQDPTADEIPATGEPLPAGRYVDDALGPAIEFRVADGWRVGPGADGPIITLESTRVPGGVLTLTRFDGDIFLDSCDSTSLSTVDASVQRVAEIIGANPLLRVAPPAIIDVDGNQSVQLDVAVPPFDDVCSQPLLLLWAVPFMENGEFIQVPHQQSRFIILDVGGDVIVIAIETFPGVPFGMVLDDAMDIVDSVRFTPAAAQAPTAAPSIEPSPEPSSAAEVTPAPTPAAATPSPTPPAPRTPTPLATDPPDA